MGFRLVNSLGNVRDMSVINMPASGTIHPGEVVDFLLTGGQGVSPAGMNSTITTIFGVAMDYVQGASDAYVKVLPFVTGQIWEADCTGSATTTHIGARMGLARTRSDNALYSNTTDSVTATAIFRCIGMTGLTTGSGKLLGFFRTSQTAGNTPASTDNF